jgi:diguanylate cyclase (GGDEF)-like protein
MPTVSARTELRRAGPMCTETPHRRHRGHELLERYQARALRGGHPTGLILLDVDRFKRINTRFGQSGGDTALIAVAQALSRALRPGDTLVRWGGEELLVFAPETNHRELERLAHRLRDAAAADLVTIGDSRLPVNVSAGAALLDGLRTVPELLAACDRALLAAKQTRNSVVVDKHPDTRAIGAGAGRSAGATAPRPRPVPIR